MVRLVRNAGPGWSPEVGWYSDMQADDIKEALATPPSGDPRNQQSPGGFTLQQSNENRLFISIYHGLPIKIVIFQLPG